MSQCNTKLLVDLPPLGCRYANDPSGRQGSKHVLWVYSLFPPSHDGREKQRTINVVSPKVTSSAFVLGISTNRHQGFY